MGQWESYGLISATKPGPVPAGIYVGAGSAARGQGSLSGSHHSRLRKVRQFTHRSHRARAVPRMNTNRWGVWRECHSLADWRLGRFSFASTAQLPLVLEPERIVGNSEIIHVCKQRHGPTKFAPFEETCRDPSLVVHALW